MNLLNYLYLLALLAFSIVAIAGPINPSSPGASFSSGALDSPDYDSSSSPSEHNVLEVRARPKKGKNKPKEPEPEPKYGDFTTKGQKYQRWLDNPSEPNEITRSTLTINELMCDGWEQEEVPSNKEVEKNGYLAQRVNMPNQLFDMVNDLKLELPHGEVYREVTLSKATKDKDGDDAQNSFVTRVGPGVIFAMVNDRYNGPAWSEVAMAVYNQWGEGELKYVFRVDVKNEQTLPFIRDTLYPGECREWDENPEVWEKGSDGYQAILGTPNGKGVGALVLGHYDRGTKNIPEIVSVVDNRTHKLQILFKIE